MHFVLMCNRLFFRLCLLKDPFQTKLVFDGFLRQLPIYEGVLQMPFKLQFGVVKFTFRRLVSESCIILKYRLVCFLPPFPKSGYQNIYILLWKEEAIQFSNCFLIDISLARRIWQAVDDIP